MASIKNPKSMAITTNLKSNQLGCPGLRNALSLLAICPSGKHMQNLYTNAGRAGMCEGAESNKINVTHQAIMQLPLQP